MFFACFVLTGRKKRSLGLGTSSKVPPVLQADSRDLIAVDDVVLLALDQERVQGDLLDSGVVAKDAGNRRLSQLVQLAQWESEIGLMTVLEVPTVSVLPVSESTSKNPYVERKKPSDS